MCFSCLTSSSNSQGAFSPKLRFSDFDDNYRQITLASISDKISRVDPHSKAPVMMISAASGFINQSEKYSRDNAGQSLKKYTLLKKGELAYNHGASKLREFGCCFELKEEEARIPYVYHSFSIKGEFAPYIAILLNNPLMDRQLKRLVSSSVRMDGLLNISYDDYMSVKLNVPTIKEQQKVYSFISILDNRIEKQQKIVECLKSYKRGLINGFIRKNESQWQTIQLAEILLERKEFCEKDGTYPHATLSKEGVYGKTDRYDRDYLVSSDDKKYKVTHYGDLCYNPANLKFGVICLNTFGDAIFSPIYVTFEISNVQDRDFVGAYLMRPDFINRALKFQQGTVYERMAVSPEDLLSMSISLPPRKEQEKMSYMLKKIDELTLKEECILSSLLTLKSGMLHQLFI